MLSNEKAMQASPVLKLKSLEMLLIRMSGKQVTLLARCISSDFSVIISDSDLALHFSFLGFKQ